MNPYFNNNFFSFFGTLIKRLGLLITGHVQSLAIDEVQIAILALLALSGAFIGSFLIFRKMTMYANSLSHTILFGIAIAFLLLRSGLTNLEGLEFREHFSSLFLGAMLSAGVTFLAIEWIHKSLKVEKDGSIGLVFTFFFALGSLLISLHARNSHLGVELVMGNLDALDASELKLQGICAVINTGLSLLLFRPFMFSSFDLEYSKKFPLICAVTTFSLCFQTALTTLCSFQAVGALVYLTFLLAPALSAKLFAKSLKQMIVIAFCIGLSFSLISVALARHLLTAYNIAISTGAFCSTLLALSYPLGLFVKVSWNYKQRAVQLPKEANL